MVKQNRRIKKTLKHKRSSLKHKRKTLKHKRSSLKHKRSSLKHKRSSLKHKRSSLKHKRNTLKNKRNFRKNRKNRTLKGGAPTGDDPKFNVFTPSPYPPGGMYKQGSDTNGLDGGYYYGYNTCPNPNTQSTIGIQVKNEIKSNKPKQNGGGIVRDVARNIGAKFQKLYSTYTTKPLPPSKNPDPYAQPINNTFNKEYEFNV